MANSQERQALSAVDELASHTRESLASLSHDALLDAAEALATRCRELQAALAGTPYIYTLPDELLQRVLLALPLSGALPRMAAT